MGFAEHFIQDRLFLAHALVKKSYKSSGKFHQTGWSTMPPRSYRQTAANLTMRWVFVLTMMEVTGMALWCLNGLTREHDGKTPLASGTERCLNRFWRA
eukprot:1883143-Amphidinium_carterae.1